MLDARLLRRLLRNYKSLYPDVKCPKNDLREVLSNEKISSSDLETFNLYLESSLSIKKSLRFTDESTRVEKSARMVGLELPK